MEAWQSGLLQHETFNGDSYMKSDFFIRAISAMRSAPAVSFISVCAAVLAMFAAGCEVDSADSSIHIDPSAARVGHVGHSVELTASGGYYYRWSLENTQLGDLDTLRGNRVVYTSLYQPADMAEMQVVYVQSYFSDSDSSYSNGTTTNGATTTTVHYAEAYITHMPVSTNQHGI